MCCHHFHRCRCHWMRRQFTIPATTAIINARKCLQECKYGRSAFLNSAGNSFVFISSGLCICHSCTEYTSIRTLICLHYHLDCAAMPIAALSNVKCNSAHTHTHTYGDFHKCHLDAVAELILCVKKLLHLLAASFKIMSTTIIAQ